MSRHVIFVLAASAILMGSIDSTIVAVAVPNLTAALDAPLTSVGLTLTAYLLVQIVSSALLGLFAWVAFAWIGLNNALFWACFGGVLHLIPYAGPTALVVITALVAYVQFDTLEPVAMIVGITLALVGVIGLLLVPWLTQRMSRINAVIVFVALLFWGWLWGVWGLLLGVPIVMAIKAVCERVEDLRPISEFLGYEENKPMSTTQEDVEVSSTQSKRRRQSRVVK